jgi:hypothetical protein
VAKKAFVNFFIWYTLQQQAVTWGLPLFNELPRGLVFFSETKLPVKGLLGTSA